MRLLTTTTAKQLPFPSVVIWVMESDWKMAVCVLGFVRFFFGGGEGHE
jgi:hypothetical protein